MNGIPQLLGAGVLIPGTPGSLVLSSAAPSAATLLLISLSSTPTQFLGGTLVPIPFLVALPFTTDPTGGIPLVWSDWPPGLPSGATLYFQYIVADQAAIHDASLSNALRADIP